MVRRDGHGRTFGPDSRSRQRVEAESWACVWSTVTPRRCLRRSEFDAVVSAFGAMFAVDQERAASEMVRVCRRGRTVGLANGRLMLRGRAVQAAGAFSPPAAMARLHAPGARARDCTSCRRLRQCLEHAQERRLSRTHAHGLGGQTAHDLRSGDPRLRHLDADGKRALRAAMLQLAHGFNRAKDASMVVDAEYLEWSLPALARPLSRVPTKIPA